MFHIREFREEDIYDVFVISSQSLTELYSLDLFIDIYHAWPQGFLVAEMRDIIGFITGTKIGDSARILMLAVQPKFRRMGIGTALLNRFTFVAKQERMRSLYLEVRVNNTNAIKFYQKHGFVITSQLDNYYTNGDSAYVMWKII